MGFSNKRFIEGIFIFVIMIALPVTIFIGFNRQDIRQRAATPAFTPTVTPNSICPEVNADGSKNSCRSDGYCLTGETVKWNGNDDCTKRLGKSSFCCQKIQ